MKLKNYFELLGIILFAIAIPYLVASLLEWNLIPLNWNHATKIVLAMIYTFCISFISFFYSLNYSEK